MFVSFHPPCFFLVQQTNACQGRLMLDVSRSHTVTHHSRLDSSERGIGPSQRLIADNTQHSQETYPCPQRDSNPQSQQESGQWNRHLILLVPIILRVSFIFVKIVCIPDVCSDFGHKCELYIFYFGRQQLKSLGTRSVTKRNKGFIFTREVVDFPTRPFFRNGGFG